MMEISRPIHSSIFFTPQRNLDFGGGVYAHIMYSAGERKGKRIKGGFTGKGKERE